MDSRYQRDGLDPFGALFGGAKGLVSQRSDDGLGAAGEQRGQRRGLLPTRTCALRRLKSGREGGAGSESGRTSAWNRFEAGGFVQDFRPFVRLRWPSIFRPLLLQPLLVFFQSTCSASQRLGVVQGGRPVRIPDPPPPTLLTPPKFLKPSFSNLRFLGKGLAPKVEVRSTVRRYFFFYPMCLYSKYAGFCGELKNV